MEVKQIKPQESGKYTIFRDDSFEYVNPINRYMHQCILSSIVLQREVIEINAPQISSIVKFEHLLRRAINDWKEKYQDFESAKIPESFVKLLHCKSKKKQIKLLRNQSITPTQLIAFIFLAFRKFGFTHSNYKSEKLHKGVKQNDLPDLIEIKDKEVLKVGATDLTDGQLKQVIEYRKVIVAKFIDKGDEWHCFFITYNSIGGKESWNGGQPHYHYLSDKWGLSREHVVKAIQNGKYPSTNVHISLLEYGNQPHK